MWPPAPVRLRRQLLPAVVAACPTQIFLLYVQLLLGRVLRAPILRAFADARAPDEVRSWVRSIASMGKFDRILTAHFASPIRAAPADFAGAFGYLDGVQADIACEDWSLLDGLNGVIEQNKLGAPVVYEFKKGCRPISSSAS